MIQLTLTLKMTAAQVVESLVAVDNNSPIQHYVHPADLVNLLMFPLLIILLIRINFPLNDPLLLLREN